MNFQEDLKARIALLQQRADFERDISLKRVVELLKEIKNEAELNEQKSLINRIAIDSIEDWDTINIISDFIKSHSNNKIT